VPKQTAASTNKENRRKPLSKSPLASPLNTGKSASSTSQHAVNPNRRTVSAGTARITGSVDTKSTRQRTTSTGPSTSPSNLNLKRRAPTASTAPLNDSKGERSPPCTRSRPGSSASERKSLAKTLPLVAQKRTTPSPSLTSTTPDLPYPSAKPVTPLKRKKDREAILSLVTPELKKSVNLGKGKTIKAENDRRQVGFAFKEDEELSDEEERSRIEEVLEGNEEAEAEGEPKVKKQRSIMEVLPAKNTAPEKRTTWAPVPSPLRGGLSSSPGEPPSPSASAHNLLHSIMKDVMYDYQEDMRTEIMGMHLDLVRMGRDWKKEMKDMTDVYSKELKELREENRLLREENERLKRGY
jgi:protein NEDD1